MSPKYFLACLLTAGPVLTGHAEPLYDQDNAPLSGIYNFVDSTEGANLLAKGRFAWSLSSITSSHAVSGLRGDERLLFDGETTRAEFESATRRPTASNSASNCLTSGTRKVSSIL